MSDNDKMLSMAMDALFGSSLMALSWADAGQIVRMKRGALTDDLVLNEPLCAHCPVLFGMQGELAAMQAHERGELSISRAAMPQAASGRNKLSIHVIWDRAFGGYILLFHLDDLGQQEESAARRSRIQRIAEQVFLTQTTPDGERSQLIDRLIHLLPQNEDNAKDIKPSKENPLQKLTARERDIVRLVISGMPNKVIAHELQISPKTVEAHRARAVKRLGVKTSAELIRMAGEFGI